MIITEGKEINEIDFTEEFDKLTKQLSKELNLWNDEQCKHHAIMKARKISALSLRGMAEILINCANKALENS